MADLQEIRRRIDRLNRELCRLLKARFQVMAEVAAAKRQSGGPVYDPVREREILAQMTELVGPEYATEIRLVFSSLLELGKNRQRLLLGREPELLRTIAAAGAPAELTAQTAIAVQVGTDSRLAAERLFPGTSGIGYDGTEAVLTAVAQGTCDYGVLAAETSDTDRTAAVYSALAEHRMFLVKALILNPEPPAGGSRFLGISRKLEFTGAAGKMSVFLTLPRRSGALNNLCSYFAAAETDLTKIVSRPVPGMADRLGLALDWKVSPREENTRRLLTELILDPEIAGFTFLGAYCEE